MSTAVSTVFVNGTIIAPDRLIEDRMLICRNGKIAGIKRRDAALPAEAVVIDAKGGYISPGFVDLHVHGGAGADFMDGTIEAVNIACQAHARHGTTTILPTTTTGSSDQIMSMLEACKTVMQSDSSSTIAGVHLYGRSLLRTKLVVTQPPDVDHQPRLNTIATSLAA